MPELPDVEVFKRYLESTVLPKSITDVEVTDYTVLANTTQPALQRELVGNAFMSVQRHGKQLFLHTDGPAILAMHFGMTGKPVYYRQPEKKPEHPRVTFTLEEGYRLAFDCQRLLGRIHLLKDIDAFLRTHEIGPDALRIDEGDFAEAIQNSRSGLKSLLMDQTRIAGIGNVYADEILFRAHLSPRHKAARLTPAQTTTLYRDMKYVLEQAIAQQADRNRYPRTWLTPQRTKKSPGCPRGCGPLRQGKVNGRTTYWCPKCQE